MNEEFSKIENTVKDVQHQRSEVKKKLELKGVEKVRDQLGSETSVKNGLESHEMLLREKRDMHKVKIKIHKNKRKYKEKWKSKSKPKKAKKGKQKHKSKTKWKPQKGMYKHKEKWKSKF